MNRREPDFRIPIADPRPRRGRKRRIYLTELEAYVRPMRPGDPRFAQLLELLFPDVEAKSTNADSHQ